MARSQKYAWFTATTRWGTVRIGLPFGTYQRATARGRDDKLFPGGAGSRDFICIRVKRRLNSAGGQVEFVHWRDITISNVSVSTEDSEQESVHLVPQHLLYEAQVAAIVDSFPVPTEDEVSEAHELFPDFFRLPSSKTIDDADFICGCVPLSVTTS